MKKGISLGLLLLALCGCRKQQDAVAYAEDPANGLRKTFVAGPVQYTVQYKPPAYILYLEHLDAAAQEQRKRQLEGVVWFNVSFTIPGFGQSPLRYQVSSLEDYTARQDYYLNGAPKDIYLLYGKDTLYVNSYWFENNQNLIPKETIVVGFKLPGALKAPEEDLKLSFYDRVFRNGIIKTVIKKEDLENIPGL